MLCKLLICQLFLEYRLHKVALTMDAVALSDIEFCTFASVIFWRSFSRFFKLILTKPVGPEIEVHGYIWKSLSYSIVSSPSSLFSAAIVRNRVLRRCHSISTPVFSTFSAVHSTKRFLCSSRKYPTCWTSLFPQSRS